MPDEETGKDLGKRIEELRAAIREADHQYYNLGESDLSDRQYDELFRELRQLEAAHPELLTEDSPTQRVGAPLPSGQGLPTAAHLAPMLSIESLQSEAEVREFAARARKQLGLPEDAAIRWSVEPKLDGVSASLLYEDGRLVRALSRGDGARGEDITNSIKTLKSVPLELAAERQGRGRGRPPRSLPSRVEIRGEVLLSREAFARLREHAETRGETPFRNPRNAVAGSLKLLNPQVVARRGMDFVCWGIGQVEGLEAASHTEVQSRLEGFGFTIATPSRTVDSIEGILDFHAELERDRDANSYEMDGIVAKVDDLELQRRLGRRSRAPRWALAYKFTARRATTRVEAISAQVGRTGAITPVAELEPVELAGVTVKRATLHNWGLLQERDIRVGDAVEIERAGDVIPAVVEVHVQQRAGSSQPFTAPEECPVCSSAVEQEGAFLYCVNLECPAQIRARIVHLASRRALDIDRLGPKYVDQLLVAGLIRRPEDIFTLPEHETEILELERWGEKSFHKLATELEKAKRPQLDRFLYGLGIRHVGETTAKDLADAFDSLDDLIAADAEQLEQVEGVGEEVAKSVLSFFATPGNQRFLEAAAVAGLQVEARARSSDGPLSGRTFCFTGGLSALGRDEARQIVEAMGAQTSSSLTKKVTDVVLGEKAGSKAQKAEKLGIHTMDEDGFLRLIGRGAPDPE